jgi:hypothetical protein
LKEKIFPKRFPPTRKAGKKCVRTGLSGKTIT